MLNDREAELKKAEAKSKENPGRTSNRRDTTMSGGVRGETRPETQERKRQRSIKREPPVIQRTPEGGVD